MEDFSSPVARQDSSYRIPIRPLRLTSPKISSDKEDRSDKWQIKPPIVTAGRISAVKLQDASPVQELKQEQWQVPLQEDQSQENAPLFEVNVMGADQQWYTITAKV